MVFLVKQVGTSLWQHCLPSQDGGMRQIWEYIIKNYSTDAAISLLVWLESHESSFMVGHFLEHLFKKTPVLQV